MEEKRKRLFYLDFIRAIAMLIIVIYHFLCHFETFNISGFDNIFYKHANGDWGKIGVTLFFMISGVALMHNYSQKIDYKLYTKKRLKSIYPMFWIAYIFVFLYDFMNNGGIDNGIPKYKLILSFIGMDGYFLYLSPNFYKIGEWFLGAIIFIYILFPLYRYLIKKDKKIATIILLIHLILNLYILQFNPFVMTANRNIIVCAFSFLLGVYFIEYVKEVKWYQALISLILFILSITIKIGLSPYLLCNISGYLLFIILKYISNFIKNNTIQNLFGILSKYSYAIFLVHHVIIVNIEQKFSNKILGKFETFCLFLLCLLIIIIAAKILSVISIKVAKLFNNQTKGENLNGKI